MRHCHAARIAAFCACVSGCNAFMPHLLALPLHKSPVGLRQYAARPRMVRGGLHLRCDTNPLPQESKGCSWDRVWKGGEMPLAVHASPYHVSVWVQDAEQARVRNGGGRRGVCSG